MSRAKKSFSAVALLIVCYLFVFHDKFFLLSCLRLQTPPDSTRLQPASNAPKTHVIDFMDNNKEGNLLFESLPNISHTFQDRGRNRLLLGGLSETSVEINSFDTLIDYKSGKLLLLTAYLLPDGTGYQRAVSAVEELAFRLASELSSKHPDGGGYERHLNVVPDTETWVPRIRFATHEISFWLNCNWSGDQPAAEEALTAICRPYLALEPL